MMVLAIRDEPLARLKSRAVAPAAVAAGGS